MLLDTLPERLREERKRKGFNQTEFAALGGVKKLSQLLYEKGERSPSLQYIAELWSSEEGIDVGYILTGKRSLDQRLIEKASWRVLDAMQSWLSLMQYEKDFIKIMSLAYEEEKDFDRGSETYLAVRELLAKSPNVMLTSFDLEEVVERVEFVLGAMGCSLDSRSKASLFFRVYQLSKAAGGRIDLNMVEGIIREIR